MIFCVFLLLTSRISFYFFRKYKTQIRSIENYIEILMLNFLFIPIFSYLASIYSCRYSENKKTPFLDTDCNYECWVGSHILIVILNFFLLIAHSILSYIYNLRQNRNISKNIRSSQTYIILKIFICILINTVEKILFISGSHSKLILAIIFLTSMIIIFLFMLKRNCFNYDRLNFWTKYLYLCVIWNTLAYIAGLLNLVPKYLVVIFDVIGWVVIIIIGAWRSHKLPPNLLIVKQGKTIHQMLKLAFDFGLLKKTMIYRIRSKDFMEMKI